MGYYKDVIKYNVILKKSEDKKLKKLPLPIKAKLMLLVDDLENKGAVLPYWKNYSKLSENEYHCHLTYSYVACWKNEKGTIRIEVYYVGSRENSPY